MTWKKVLAMLFGGILLALGGCGMFIAFQMEGVGQMGGLLFVIGVVLFVVGVAAVFVKAVKALFTRSKAQTP